MMLLFFHVQILTKHRTTNCHVFSMLRLLTILVYHPRSWKKTSRHMAHETSWALTKGRTPVGSNFLACKEKYKKNQFCITIYTFYCELTSSLNASQWIQYWHIEEFIRISFEVKLWHLIMGEEMYHALRIIVNMSHKNC